VEKTRRAGTGRLFLFPSGRFVKAPREEFQAFAIEVGMRIDAIASRSEPGQPGSGVLDFET
jgi:hypothetical protein